MHGQIAHPDPFVAAMEAVEDDRTTRSSCRPSRASAPAGSGVTSSARLRAQTDCPSSTSWSRTSWERRHERARRAAPRPPRRAPRAAAREPELARRRAHARHAPLHRVGDHALRLVLRGLLLHPRRQSGRVDDHAGGVAVLASLQGAAGRRRVHGRPVRVPGLRRRREHRDPRDLELHDALGAAVDQARSARRRSSPAWCSRSSWASRSSARRSSST